MSVLKIVGHEAIEGGGILFDGALHPAIRSLADQVGRFRRESGSARTWPALTYSIDEAEVPNMTWTCPLSRSVTAAATLRYGTWTILMPVMALNSSPLTWGVLPLPGDAMLILPGLALA